MEVAYSRAWRFLRYGSALLLYLRLASFLPLVNALHVVPGSNCTGVCTQQVDATNTMASDVTCYDQDYNGTVVGKAFQNCVSCEMKSRTFDHQSTQTDLGWALYNIRYVVDTCLYDYPQANNQNASKPCQQSCSNITNALETNIREANVSTPYDYCQDPRFVSEVGPCASCYSVVPNQQYISNFLNTLKVACITKPSTTTPFSVVPADVFTLDPPKTFPTSLSMPEPGAGLPHGAVVAIGICVPVFFFLVLTLVFLYCYLKIQNRTSTKKRARRSQRFNEKAVLEPHHGWHQESTARIRPVSHVAPLRTRYSNPLAQIAENPSRSGSQSDATAGPVSENLVPKRSSRPAPPPMGLMSWERRALEEASEKDYRLSASLKSTQQPSGSTTVVPSDGRRDSGNSGHSDDDEQEHQRSIMSLTPPPLFSIPESGSSSPFHPARSGTPWNRDHSAEPRRSTSRNSRRSEGPQRSQSRTSRRSEELDRSLSRMSSRPSQEMERSVSRMSRRSEELDRSLSRISRRSQDVERSLSRLSQREQEPRISTSRRSETTKSPEPTEKALPEKPTSEEEVDAREPTTKKAANSQRPQTPPRVGPQEPRLSIFRDVSYAPKPDD